MLDVRKQRLDLRSPKSLLFLACFLCFVFCLLSFIAPVVAENWDKAKGEHFIVYHTGSRRSAREVLDKAEEYYKKIADDLGYARHSNFWAWENRVAIYIYSDREAYLSYIKANNYATWSVGMARYKEKEIISYDQSRGFLDATLPHEITHLIFRDYVGEENIPIWIDEGVAQWEEKGKRQVVRKKMQKLLQHHNPIPIERMMILDVGRIENEVVIELFYVEAVSLIDFLITEHGADNFIFFCRHLRDGKDINEALTFTYPTSIRSVKVLQEKWLKNLQE